MKTSTRIISHELFLMSRHPISDFVLLITTSNVVWWNKNVKTTLQEVILGRTRRNVPKMES
jgi:hypothetical protein